MKLEMDHIDVSNFQKKKKVIKVGSYLRNVCENRKYRQVKLIISFLKWVNYESYACKGNTHRFELRTSFFKSVK